MKLFTIVTTVLLLLSACNKKNSHQEPPVQAKWLKMSGNYKVYDSLGVYVYDLHVNHYLKGYVDDQVVNYMQLGNLDGDFDFIVQQTKTENPNVLFINAPNSAMDPQGHGWNLTGIYEDYWDNGYRNDTIFLRFNRNNAACYQQENVPFVSRNCRQIAVKQP
jgi:hypothetical protein